MDIRRLGKALLFPPAALVLLLVPTATAFLVTSLVLFGESLLAYASYALAAYTLTVVCARIPRLIKAFKIFREENKYARRWREDTRLRVNVSLYGSLLWNALYGGLQLWLGIYHRTFWFLSLGGYSICLAVMRFFLLRHTRRYAPGERIRSELRKYRACGWVFLVMNTALSLIVFFMVYWNRTFVHDMITAIALAAYTFTALTLAIVSCVRYRRYESPVFSASKAIGLAAALVSILTLESTMLTTFGGEEMTAVGQKWMLAGTGAAVLSTILAMAIRMILVATRALRETKEQEGE